MDPLSQLGEGRERLGEVLEQRREDLEPIVRRVRFDAWKALSNGLSALLVLPRVVVGTLGALADVADRLSARKQDLSERGRHVAERGRETAADLTERSLDLVAAVPPSRRERRQRTLRLVLASSVGFGLGLGIGWLLGRRAAHRVLGADADVTAHLTAGDGMPEPLDPAVEHPEAAGATGTSGAPPVTGGAAGAAGAAGSQGAAGSEGAAGSQGAAGSEGSAGSEGAADTRGGSGPDDDAG